MSSLPGAFRLLVATCLCVPAPLLAQASAVVDEATLTITQNGATLGRESFRILRAPGPGGQVFQATVTSVLGEVKATSRLGTDSSGRPVIYESEVSERGELVQRLKGRGRPGRFGLLVQTRTGESSREFVVSNGALLLDEELFSQFFFVALAAEHPEVIVIAPRTAQQVRMRLEARTDATVVVAGRTLPARHFTLVTDDGSRDVWVDGAGRVLKVAIPGRGLVALRDDPPQ
jgi:hypothetical protein